MKNSHELPVFEECIQSKFDEIYSDMDSVLRNGVVNATSYTKDGMPIGGHYTMDAMGRISTCIYNFAELTGLPLDKAELELFRTVK